MKAFFGRLAMAAATAGVVCLVANGALANDPERPFDARSHETVVASCAGGFGALYEGVGNATHLGLFTDSACTITTGGSFPVFDFESQGVVTAANGDQIFFMATGVTNVSDDPCVAQGTLTIVGGTGRFVGASGTTEIVALLPWIDDFTCGPEQTTTSIGTITY